MRVCFNGCSLTVGEGFLEHTRNQYIYDRLLSQQFKFDSVNIAVGGSSNHTIFMRSAREILSGKHDIVFTQWTSLNRMWLYPGPDTAFFTNDRSLKDYQYRDWSLSAQEKTVFCNTLLLMNHDYNNIIELIDYCDILSALAVNTNTRLIFINGLVPWQQDLLCSDTNIDLDKSLSAYTKSILDFDHRSDKEILDFFTKLCEKFRTLDQSKWVNLFDSFTNFTVDDGPLGHHPGPVSHQRMANDVANYLVRNSII